jgi:HPt (histidine-containing phosphotransfer) domain-containing protein
LRSLLQSAAGGSPHLLANFILSYLENSPALRASIRGAFEAGDHAALRIAAHSLRGSSSMLGAERLATLCQELETEATQERSSQLALLAVEEESQRVCQALVAVPQTLGLVEEPINPWSAAGSIEN